MGIWQPFTFASDFERPIYSIYPQNGDQSVKKISDLFEPE